MNAPSACKQGAGESILKHVPDVETAVDSQAQALLLKDRNARGGDDMNARRRDLVLAALIASWFATLAFPALGQASAPSGPGAVTRPDDLSSIRAIAVDALQLAQSGDLRRARDRTEALESQWRDAKPRMGSLLPQRRQAIDSAIDRVERELRFWRARRTDSAAALQTLVDVIDGKS